MFFNGFIVETELYKHQGNGLPLSPEQIGTRIKEVADSLGTRKKAVEIAEVSADTLQRWFKGEVNPGLFSVGRLCDAAGYSIDWVVSGVGNKFRSQVSSVLEAQGVYASNTFKTDEFALINMYDAEVSMGDGAWHDRDNIVSQLAFRRDWLSYEGLKAEKCALILARGDSMEGTIDDGATILINLEDSVLSRDGVYVIRFDGHLLAKRLQRSYDGSVFIKSDNKAYNEIHVPADQVNNIDIVGRVAWYASTI